LKQVNSPNSIPAKLSCYTVLKIIVYVCCNTGDVILADRGFICDEYARMMLAEVKTPPFTKGKTNLKLDINWSRELSLVRIHVERIHKWGSEAEVYRCSFHHSSGIRP